ncbi:CBS domain-containing protein [Streptomyces marincola]|uniref:Oxidoreductase n=1 Tax=Streptomyces marincola TaxID=2878388 RepID=A0A1W7CSX3_9ACTN|nr:CBS domain-containing protein [Streptomyces marincola]ARQ67806.1 oxidoreductase [Streptomyces marincola]
MARSGAARVVRDVMTPVTATLRPDASLVEAAQLMRAQDTGDVLVVRDGVLHGVLTDRDITLRAVAEGMDPVAVSCQAVCTADPVYVGPDTGVATAARLMNEHAVRRLPVVDRSGVVGWVRAGDIGPGAAGG